jgi:hypothetical protein
LKHGKKFTRRKSKNPSRGFAAMYTNAPFLTKPVISIKIDSAHAIVQYRFHASYPKICAGAGK